MAHVFISYKRQDAAFARTLRSRIIAAGMDVWMDDQLRAGEDWRASIDNAIREAFALVVIMTRAAKHSEYVTYEWACAWGANVPVIPVLLEVVPLHPRLDTLQHRDFSDPVTQPFNLLIDDLRHFQDEYNARRLHENMPPPVRRAFEALNAYDINDRHRALDGLAQMQHPAALEALKRAVTSAFYDDVRLFAALRVVQRAPDHCAMALAHLESVLDGTLTGDDNDLLTEVLIALRQVSDPDAVPALIALHNSGGDRAKDVIRDVIERIGADAVPQLMTLLNDGDDHVQQTVSRLLIAIGSEAVPALIHALQTTHTAVRFIAAHILGEIGSPQAVPAMIGALDPSDTHLRRVLVYALGRMADPRAIPALIRCLDDRDMQTVAAAVDALSRMDARDAVSDLCHVVHRPEPTLKLAAIQALGRLGDPRAADTLIGALEYNELQFRLTVVEALGRIQAAAAVPGLVAMLYTEQERALQLAAEKALERIGTHAALSALNRWRSPAVTRPLAPPDEPDVSRAGTRRAPHRPPAPTKTTLLADSDNFDVDPFDVTRDDPDPGDDAPWPDWYDSGV